MPASAVAATAVILSAGVLGILFACFLFFHVSRILVNPKDSKPGLMASINDEDAAAMARLYEIYENIRGGASAFLWAEYKCVPLRRLVRSQPHHFLCAGHYLSPQINLLRKLM